MHALPSHRHVRGCQVEADCRAAESVSNRRCRAAAHERVADDVADTGEVANQAVRKLFGNGAGCPPGRRGSPGKRQGARPYRCHSAGVMSSGFVDDGPQEPFDSSTIISDESIGWGRREELTVPSERSPFEVCPSCQVMVAW